jgi:hypothetical protein
MALDPYDDEMLVLDGLTDDGLQPRPMVGRGIGGQAMHVGFKMPFSGSMHADDVVNGFRCAVAGRHSDIPVDAPVGLAIRTRRELPRSASSLRVGEPDTFYAFIEEVALMVLGALDGVAWADRRQVFKVDLDMAPRTAHGTGCEIGVFIDYMGGAS